MKRNYIYHVVRVYEYRVLAPPHRIWPMMAFAFSVASSFCRCEAEIYPNIWKDFFHLKVYSVFGTIISVKMRIAVQSFCHHPMPRPTYIRGHNDDMVVWYQVP